MFALTEEAQVKLGAEENQVFVDKSLAKKRKKTGEMCLAPIFLPQLATEFFSLSMDRYLSISIV